MAELHPSSVVRGATERAARRPGTKLTSFVVRYYLPLYLVCWAACASKIRTTTSRGAHSKIHRLALVFVAACLTDTCRVGVIAVCRHACATPCLHCGPLFASCMCYTIFQARCSWTTQLCSDCVSSYRLNSIQWREFSSALQVNFAPPHEND